MAYNKGLRICLRSLKTTSIHALEVEAGSVPLDLRRQYLARRECLKVYEKNLPICEHLENIRTRLDDHGLTILERNVLSIDGLLGTVCRADLRSFPDNCQIRELVDPDERIAKKHLSAKQWKHLVETMLSERYENHYKIYTDASKQLNGNTGVGLTDLGRVRSHERISNLFQITNAEMVAILKAVMESESVTSQRVVILTDSLSSCKLLRNGSSNNYIVHLLREQIQRISGKEFILQCIPSHVGVEGNDQADDFALRATYLDVISPLRIAFSDALNELKVIMIKEWNDVYQHKSLTKGIHHFKVVPTVGHRPWFCGSGLNGLEIKIITRLRTGHGLCGCTRFLFGLEESTKCDVCKVVNDLEHIVLNCEKYRDIRSRYDLLVRHDGLP